MSAQKYMRTHRIERMQLLSGLCGLFRTGSETFIKDTGAYEMTHMCLGVVLNGESSYRQAVFTSRKGASSSQVVTIET